MGLVLEGILNMPYPEDPKEMGVVEWSQAVGGMRSAWMEIERLRDLVAVNPTVCEFCGEPAVRVIDTWAFCADHDHETGHE